MYNETKDSKQEILPEKDLKEHIKFARRGMSERIEDIKNLGWINERESKKLKEVVGKWYFFMEANPGRY